VECIHPLGTLRFKGSQRATGWDDGFEIKDKLNKRQERGHLERGFMGFDDRSPSPTRVV